jgi:hypothetical protein
LSHPDTPESPEPSGEQLFDEWPDDEPAEEDAEVTPDSEADGQASGSMSIVDLIIQEQMEKDALVLAPASQDTTESEEEGTEKDPVVVPEEPEAEPAAPEEPPAEPEAETGAPEEPLTEPEPEPVASEEPAEPEPEPVAPEEPPAEPEPVAPEEPPTEPEPVASEEPPAEPEPESQESEEWDLELTEEELAELEEWDLELTDEELAELRELEQDLEAEAAAQEEPAAEPEPVPAAEEKPAATVLEEPDSTAEPEPLFDAEQFTSEESVPSTATLQPVTEGKPPDGPLFDSEELSPEPSEVNFVGPSDGTVGDDFFQSTEQLQAPSELQPPAEPARIQTELEQVEPTATPAQPQEQPQPPEPVSTTGGQVGGNLRQLEDAFKETASKLPQGVEKRSAQAMQFLASLPGIQRGLVVVQDSSGDLQCTAVGGVEREYLDKVPQRLLKAVLRAEKSHLLLDATKDPRFMNDPVVQSQGIKSGVCAPFQDCVTGLQGLLYADNLEEANAFTYQDLRLIDEFADRLSRDRVLQEFEQPKPSAAAPEIQTEKTPFDPRIAVLAAVACVLLIFPALSNPTKSDPKPVVTPNVTRVTTDPQVVVLSFLRSVETSNYRSAYKYLIDERRQQIEEETFGKEVSKFAKVADNAWLLSQLNILEGRGQGPSKDYKLLRPDQTLAWTISVKRQEGSWYISKISGMNGLSF